MDIFLPHSIYTIIKTLLFHLNVKHLYSMLNTLSTTSSTIAAAGAAGNGMNAASLMLRSEANQKEVDELHKRLSVLTEDIAHKQTLIDRLLKEVDKRSE